MLHLLTTPSLPSFPANTKPHHHDHHSLTPNRSKAFPHPHRPLRCAGSGSGSGSVNVEVDTFTKRSGYLFELTASEADSLAEYNVSKISVIYKRKPLVLIRRLVQIGTTFGRWFGLRYLDQIMERSEQMFEVRAAELRKILVELGPNFKNSVFLYSNPYWISNTYLFLQSDFSPELSTT